MALLMLLLLSGDLLVVGVLGADVLVRLLQDQDELVNFFFFFRYLFSVQHIPEEMKAAAFLLLRSLLFVVTARRCL